MQEVSIVPNQEVAKKLNDSVARVISNDQLQGFEKAYLMADSIKQIKAALTPEYMKPIMELQGSNLGFKTDKDKDNGYPEAVVKNCLVEAVLLGVQPYDNQFNIIAGNCYLTKNGIGVLLKKLQGLTYDIVFELPRVNQAKDGAAITAKITWEYKGIKGSKNIEIPVKMNAFMGTDGVIGKATRKARKWLHDYLTGSEIPEGDVMDIDFKVVETKQSVSQVAQDAEFNRIKAFIEKANTIDELEMLLDLITTEDLKTEYENRKTQLK